MRVLVNGVRLYFDVEGAGLVPDGAAMSPTHTRRAGKLYRYYISQTALKQRGGRKLHRSFAQRARSG